MLLTQSASTDKLRLILSMSSCSGNVTLTSMNHWGGGSRLKKQTTDVNHPSRTYIIHSRSTSRNYIGCGTASNELVKQLREHTCASCTPATNCSASFPPLSTQWHILLLFRSSSFYMGNRKWKVTRWGKAHGAVCWRRRQFSRNCRDWKALLSPMHVPVIGRIGNLHSTVMKLEM